MKKLNYLTMILESSYHIFQKNLKKHNYSKEFWSQDNENNEKSCDFKGYLIPKWIE